jgi:hypothetical protein
MTQPAAFRLESCLAVNKAAGSPISTVDRISRSPLPALLLRARAGSPGTRPGSKDAPRGTTAGYSAPAPLVAGPCPHRPKRSVSPLSLRNPSHRHTVQRRFPSPGHPNPPPLPNLGRLRVTARGRTVPVPDVQTELRTSTESSARSTRRFSKRAEESRRSRVDRLRSRIRVGIHLSAGFVCLIARRRGCRRRRRPRGEHLRSCGRRALGGRFGGLLTTVTGVTCRNRGLLPGGLFRDGCGTRSAAACT